MSGLWWLYVRFMVGFMLFHRWFILGVCSIDVLVHCWFMFGLFGVYFGSYAIGFNVWLIVCHSFYVWLAYVWFMLGVCLVYAGFIFGFNGVHVWFIVGSCLVYVWLNVG